MYYNNTYMYMYTGRPTFDILKMYGFLLLATCLYTNDSSDELQQLIMEWL